MKLNWLLTGIFSSTSLVAGVPTTLPAHANSVTSWQFNPRNNQIDLTTDESVRPRAILIDGPYRVVLDLPGAKLAKKTIRKQYGGAVREIRIGQVDNNNARMVIELKPGYAVNREDILIRSELPSRWMVKLNSVTSGAPTSGTGRSESIAIAPPVFAGGIPVGQEMYALKARIKKLAAKYDDVYPGLFFMDMQTGNYLDINGDRTFPAASTIKLPILIALFQAVDNGTVRLDENLRVRGDLIAGGSGRLQYSRGATLSVLRTATLMSVISDNTATNMIIDRLGGKDKLNRQFLAWGMKKTTIRRLLGDFKGTNTTSPADLVRLSAMIAKRQLISEGSRSKVLDILNQTTNRKLLPAGLGKGAAIAHKTGTLGRLIGDAGIIEMPNGKLYFAGVFVKRNFGSLRARKFVQEVSRITYYYITERQITENPTAGQEWAMMGKEE
jgi:beta-lactamase class A